MVLATRRPAADWATVSAERAPPEPPLAWLITIFIKKILSPLSLYKNTGCNTLQSGGPCEVCFACIIRWCGSRDRRVLAGRSGAMDWPESSEQPAGRQRQAAPAPPCRDVYGPRWWKLAASRARVGGCRSRGLGLHLPILPCSLHKFKDTCH